MESLTKTGLLSQTKYYIYLMTFNHFIVMEARALALYQK